MSLDSFQSAVLGNDATRLRELLVVHPELKSKLDDPLFAFDTPAMVCAAGQGSRDVIDALLDSGADINARSQWWAGSFGVLDSANPELAAYLIERGATVDVHAAARLGMLDRLKELISADPELVHARGGDGQTPLHFASTIEIATYLLEQGADIDARDVDHESTPAQYMLGSRLEIARYLIARGAMTDILMAAAVGDIELVRKHLAADPDCNRTTVSEECFPKQNPRSGGSIYNWTLGRGRSPHQVASKHGHTDVLKLLMERSPLDVKLINACLIGDAATARSILADHPHLLEALSSANRDKISDAAEDNNAQAVRLMLECGWPVDRGERATPLHCAAWNGNPEMARLILEYHPPLERRDPSFNATPLQWAVYGSEHGPNRVAGGYAAVVQVLLDAGAKPPQAVSGSEAVRQVLTANRRPPPA